ncbi:MAG: AAA family ATPase, partial [Actinomycetota bacterium]|nr:AAA family ATPase [Actinomycetota bacterium]
MRMMGAESVDYHRSTVLERSDDHPGQALDYYASRGETPLVWGGRGAAALGLSGNVTSETYEAIYGPGGAVDPSTGTRMVKAKRPGLELVIGAHKSVAELGVIGRAEHMHSIMDAERDATLGYLDDLTRRMGGRRGGAATPTPTDGLTYAVTRHATSRAGDPSPHDHVLLANVVRMNDAKGGTKGADTALWREHLHAATAIGRLAGARRAVELGYGIAADHGPSGRLGQWAIDGIPKAALDVHSKRAAEINDAVNERGTDTYRSRQVAARATRDRKRHEPVEDLMARWRAELDVIGHPVHELEASVAEASRTRTVRSDVPTRSELEALVASTLAPDSPLAQRKVFTRKDVVVAVAPQLFGCDPSVLPKVVDRVLGDPEAVPLLGVAEKREQAYATARGIATEQAIAATVATMAERTDAPAVTRLQALEAIARREAALAGHDLTSGQDLAIRGIATSGRGADIVVGVAGSGKTTALAAVRDAFTEAGYDVVGTAVSGQAARTLATEAGIDPSRTVASILWRLDHHRLTLTDQSVLVLDEAGMADDATTLRLLTAAELARAKVVIVGDDRQLPAIGAGGAMGAFVERHPAAVHVLAENVRQADAGEREALAQLRSGDVGDAVDWYVANHRIVAKPNIEEARKALVMNWAADLKANPGADVAMFAWRRANVAELNRLGRAAWAELGHLSGPELVVGAGSGSGPGSSSTAYAAGDRIVTLAPGARGQLVTSERGSVVSVDPGARTLIAEMDDGRMQDFASEDIAGDRLAHGYAVTVHRSQGLTVDRTHGLDDGGGRELAYVRMSRARTKTLIYAVADDVEMAADDLRRSWSNETRQRWAIDRLPSSAPVPKPAPSASPAVRLARLTAEYESLAALVPPKPGSRTSG